MLNFDLITAWVQAHTKSDRGASLVEYALLVALIAVFCIGAIGILGGSASDTLGDAGSAIGGAS